MPDVQDELAEWWTTSLTRIRPGEIVIRGFRIEELIGQVSLPAVAWLMLTGNLPGATQERLLTAAMVASVDHGPQAPSIAAARMTATCGVGMNNALATGVNALGDVHGGAGEQAMRAFHDILTRWDACHDLHLAVRDYLDALPRGAFVPGFGHRFHDVDPRSGRLLALVDDATECGTVGGRFAAIGRALEDELRHRRHGPIPMNVDGATAVVYSELGLAPPLGKALFTLARSVGIVAHAWEEINNGTRIKGPMPPRFGPRYTGAAPRNTT